MPTIGNITVPEPDINLTPWPVAPEYPFGRAHRPMVVEHRMGPGSANGKVSQRYLLGTAAKVFTIRRSQLTDSQRRDLAQFWQDNRGTERPFYYDAPKDDGTTTEYLVRFADQALALEFVHGAICAVGLDLVEVPTANPTYAINSTLERFPTNGFEDDLLAQVQ
jgi:CRISPR/Cas system endoribonuclease Cas6 (RAMP superfamily)